MQLRRYEVPCYELNCEKCNNKLDIFCRYSELEYLRCEKCSGSMKQIIGAPGCFIFKGEGFYETEHGKQQYNRGK